MFGVWIDHWHSIWTKNVSLVLAAFWSLNVSCPVCWMGQHFHAVVIVDFVACHQSDVVLALLLDVFVPRVRCSMCIVVLFLCRMVSSYCGCSCCCCCCFCYCLRLFCNCCLFLFFRCYSCSCCVDNGDLLHSVAVIGGDVGGASGCCTGGLPWRRWFGPLLLNFSPYPEITFTFEWAGLPCAHPGPLKAICQNCGASVFIVLFLLAVLNSRSWSS